MKTLEAMKKLRKALFKVGDVVEYLGDRKHWDGEGSVIFQKGMRFRIDDVYPPRKGLGKLGVDEDTGEDLVDYDQDGYNTYKRYPNDHGIIIWPRDKNDWKLVKE
jgi:hypothetical protein